MATASSHMCLTHVMEKEISWQNVQAEYAFLDSVRPGSDVSKASKSINNPVSPPRYAGDRVCKTSPESK
ncbi:hypothetical protein CENSYa_0144 [Cenarchaeum symbiosum A]|uniref:Uncharacterized protein n=1 Tax=Cenarchaeum symbiosum (strain A) TaxID=414004 RepID=A0RTX2_CENSY|nr:hypothetical protein CENSYa_0144 [Cenarchaeum symbiosum A]